MMRVRRSCLLLLMLVASPVTAADEMLAKIVEMDVKKLMEATASGKYQVVVAMTHPKLLELLGGKEKAEKTIKATMKEIQARGFTFEVQQINKPTVVRGKEDYFAVATYTMVVKGMGKKVTAKTAVIGVSTDKGKTWKYINLEDGGEDAIRRFLPDLPRELKIPRMEKTVEDI